ncbi:hypothetical protein AS180_19420 [Priestia veravalensis]|uniref:Uncharacterized protein n=1 Tax=Priestia veravalensis TaxID=1414648 RepID=A0A0V8JGZ4_9BACI|nr:hypothetical protein AS180_19420 [Priestia veravalensis]SCC54628.1 hypothetical protein GA0061087_108313 [Priestia flexa]
MNKKEKAKFSFKMNILFIVVFLLFTTLIIRLFFVQIVNGEAYQKGVASGKCGFTTLRKCYLLKKPIFISRNRLF